ncbi:unnamed protein product [Danaus chrysippus]|uniref:(African queen) hypothetical protein n=1 Tax=Danaus chrysippus TaxID=151541 RepID=A0A8J2VVV4_9NEOP|nr:unnamed protein product [Danaus chrysippus]
MTYDYSEGLLYGFDKLNSTDLEFDFEIKVDDILNETSDKFYKDEVASNNNALLIAACTATALATSVAIFIYGKKALLDYLQSGKYAHALLDCHHCKMASNTTLVSREATLLYKEGGCSRGQNTLNKRNFRQLDVRSNSDMVGDSRNKNSLRSFCAGTDLQYTF